MGVHLRQVGGQLFADRAGQVGLGERAALGLEARDGAGQDVAPRLGGEGCAFVAGGCA